MPINIGFTGTRKGMNHKQLRALEQLIGFSIEKHTPVPVHFHHGDCIGADMEAATIAKALGCFVVGWPPVNEKLRAFFNNDKTQAAMEYLKRDRVIVELADIMLAAPDTKTFRPRSGTWYTIKYAQSCYKNCNYERLFIIEPDIVFPSTDSDVANLATQMIQ